MARGWRWGYGQADGDRDGVGGVGVRGMSASACWTARVRPRLGGAARVGGVGACVERQAVLGNTLPCSPHPSGRTCGFSAVGTAQVPCSRIPEPCHFAAAPEPCIVFRGSRAGSDS